MKPGNDRPVTPDRRRSFMATVAELTSVLAALDQGHLQAVVNLAEDVRAAWAAGGKFLVCGNGGSAADSQHIVAELAGRFQSERPGYPALALTTNTSTLTAVGNDYGFARIFARQVQALGGASDVLLVISTSGDSANCLEAVAAAREHGMRVHGFLGGTGGALAGLVDSALIVPSDSTPRIQEVHITMGHLLCGFLDRPDGDGA